MGTNGWQERILRAKTLSGDYPFAAQILNFYCTIAEFQEELYARIERAASEGANPAHRKPLIESSSNSSRAATSETSPGRKSGVSIDRASESLQGRHSERESGRHEHPSNNPPVVAGPPELSALLASFPSFLSIIEKNGPPNLAAAARQLRSAPTEVQTELLNDFWDGSRPAANDSTHPASATNEFFARAFLQPYAAFTRVRAESSSNGYTGSLCPFCGRKPGVAVLRPLGDGGQRRLVCSFCLAEWEFRRIVCANCGEEDHKKLPVYTADQFPHVRVDCCDNCRQYLKTVDLTKTGLADPVVDELATIPLDLWAREHGYEKVELNLLQL
jgi:FdhE protein